MKKRLFGWICLILVLAAVLNGCGGKKKQEPELPAQQNQPVAEETYTVYAYTPDSWSDIRIWAWSDTYGDLFTAWPGDAMTDDGYGWYAYAVPMWVDKVIINGNGGSVQTADLPVETRDLWIVVYDDGGVSISYSDPAVAAQWEEPEPAAQPDVGYVESDAYDQLFASMGVQDVRVVSRSLSVISCAAVTDGTLMKQEYGYSGNGVEELSFTIYFDVTGKDVDQVRQAQQWLQDTYGSQVSGIDFCKITSDRIGNHIRYIMCFRDLDNAANARQLCSFMGIDPATLDQSGRIPVPTASEMLQEGYCVKIG